MKTLHEKKFTNSPHEYRGTVFIKKSYIIAKRDLSQKYKVNLTFKKMPMSVVHHIDRMKEKNCKIISKDQKKKMK